MIDQPTTTDRIRQLFVTGAYLLGIIGVLFGVGVLGTAVQDSPGGDLAADATLVAPASPAFSIWSVIYLLLTAYVIYQWLPSQTASPRQRAIGWMAGVTIVLNAVWLLVTQEGWIWPSLAVIVILLASLIWLVRRLHLIPRRADGGSGVAEALSVDVAFGLYLGWTLAATGANFGAALASSDLDPGRWEAIAIIVVATLAGAALLTWLGGRVSIAAALAWGLAWIAWNRFAGDPIDTVVGIVAGICALVILGAATAGQARERDDRHPLAL